MKPIKFPHPVILILPLFSAFNVLMSACIGVNAATGLLVCSAILIMLAVTARGQFFVFPRRIRKAQTQSIPQSGEPEFRFTATGITRTDKNGESAIPWGKFSHWLEDGKVPALFSADFTIHRIPKRRAPPEQWAEIRRMIAGANIPVRSTNRLATLIVTALLPLVILPINCLLLFRLMFYFPEPLSGA